MPIIVYTAKDLTRKEEAQLKKLAQTIIIKDVRSPERLLDETALFLHRVHGATCPRPSGDIAGAAPPDRQRRAGRASKVLIVDDDIRNIFALTSVLERHQMEVLSAENGQAAIETCWRRTPASTSC